MSASRLDVLTSLPGQSPYGTRSSHHESQKITNDIHALKIAFEMKSRELKAARARYTQALRSEYETVVTKSSAMRSSRADEGVRGRPVYRQAHFIDEDIVRQEAARETSMRRSQARGNTKLQALKNKLGSIEESEIKVEVVGE